MLRKIRIVLATVFFVGITLLFVGIGQDWWGWMAKLQLLPAIFRVIGGATLGNVAIICGILLVSLVFGRIYCSVICPMGVFQDLVIALRRKFSKKKFRYSPNRIWRQAMLVLLIASIFISGQLVISLVAPYSAYGRIVRSIVALVAGENIALPLLVTAVVTLVVIFLCAWFWGRFWCNNICPVGTILGNISMISLFGFRIDTDKCVNCGVCGKKCKASCIDTANHKIDSSRCVDCFDCIENCSAGAISYGIKHKGNKPKKEDKPVDGSRRKFMGTAAALTGAVVAAKAQEMKVDGGFADVEPKQEPNRNGILVPFGALSVKNFYDQCTSCQLCVSACPNKVLRPSTDLEHFLQPKMGFEEGYCRPECTECGNVCPSGAIRPIQKEEKLGIKIGTAHIDLDLCLAATGKEKCGNCERHCPVGAIRMVASEGTKLMHPVVFNGQCIGCGACEHLCPVRPISAITVNGLEVHRNK